MANKVLRLCVILLLLATLPVTVLAQEWDPDRLGSLSLSLVSRDGEVPLAGAELALYYVASVEADAEGALRYFLTEPFAGSGISLEDTELTEKLDAFVMTNDFNLNKVAEFQGVPVLNINDLANAIKSVVLPGEEMKIVVIKDGKESAQGIGYLDDGTMIVVEGGRKFIGEEIFVIVTSVLQTSAGRMIFAKPKEN